ncbi:unnamed protein product [Closterium sp. NIES-54]
MLISPASLALHATWPHSTFHPPPPHLTPLRHLHLPHPPPKPPHLIPPPYPPPPLPPPSPPFSSTHGPPALRSN